MKIHSSVRRDNVTAAAAAVAKYKGSGNVLICWEHVQMAAIAAAIGATQYAEESGWTGVIDYPHKRFDLIWVIPEPYTQIMSIEGEQIPVLDDGKTPTQGHAARLSDQTSLSLLLLVAAHIVYNLLRMR